MLEPTGFQVVEELLFPSIETENHVRLLQELKAFSSITEKLKDQLKTNAWKDQNIFEASRLQLLRIISLGITGFDSPVALFSIDEAKVSLQGIEKTLLYYAAQSLNQSEVENLKKRFDVAIQYLTENNDFNAFDRGTFIVDFLNPLSEAILAYQKSCGVANNKWLSPVNMETTNFASASNIQLAWFAPAHSKDLISQPEVIKLGKSLFFDPILSGNHSRSCASCHKPEKTFTDGQVKSVAFNFQGSIDRNAPTLINAGFQKNQFADSRVQFLEDQIVDVISNTKEMHGQIQTAVNLVAQSEEYNTLFRNAFSTADTNAVTEERMQLALSAYVRSLNGFNAKADQYFNGNKQAMSAGEIAGLNLFMGKAKCATCHFVPLFNGSVPPAYNETESEILGVPIKPDTMNAKVDPDLGKFNTYKRNLHRNAFKTPTVRNAGLTAPYMHNGVYATLEEVIDFYNRGGGAGIGINLENQTLPPEPLNLTANEKRDLISFLHALTDTTGLTNVPTRLPLFKDKKLDERKTGGDY
ncbi:MAG: cytochrome-c peroxidase [Cytophagia bacterium]|nr:cytochrome-c peroxidase [Cytophagia bacterium]